MYCSAEAKLLSRDLRSCRLVLLGNEVEHEAGTIHTISPGHGRAGAKGSSGADRYSLATVSASLSSVARPSGELDHHTSPSAATLACRALLHAQRCTEARADLFKYSKDSSTRRRGSMSSFALFDPTCFSAKHAVTVRVKQSSLSRSERYHRDEVALAQLWLLRSDTLELFWRDDHDRRVQVTHFRVLLLLGRPSPSQKQTLLSDEDGRLTSLSGVDVARMRVMTPSEGEPDRNTSQVSAGAC
eukprot:3190069-Rhodomonas_salina.1